MYVKISQNISQRTWLRLLSFVTVALFEGAIDEDHPTLPEPRCDLRRRFEVETGVKSTLKCCSTEGVKAPNRASLSEPCCGFFSKSGNLHKIVFGTSRISQVCLVSYHWDRLPKILFTPGDHFSRSNELMGVYSRRGAGHLMGIRGLPIGPNQR